MSGKIIKFSINEQNYEILIDDSRKVYTSVNYDVTIIEIKKNDGLDKNSFLEVDDDIVNEENENHIERKFKDLPVYILHYPKDKKITFSFGKTTGIEMGKSNIIHKCNTEPGSSGSPLFCFRDK